jgi:DNA-binding XRE family transcriptional regulator
LELDYYLWKNKILHKDFAKEVGIATHTLSVLVNKKSSPTLFTALKIYFATDRAVSLFELLKPEDREILDKMYSIVKKDSIYKDDKPEEKPAVDVPITGYRKDK